MRIPTIVMTASEEEPVLDMGVQVALRKPFRARELLAVVKQYCRAST